MNDGQIVQTEGNLGRDWEPKQVTVRGEEVTLWKSSVAVNNGGKDAPPTWVNLTIWPDRDTNSDGHGRIVADRTGKGTKIMVKGKVKVSEYQGKPKYDLSVWTIAEVIRPPLSDQQIAGAFPGAEWKSSLEERVIMTPESMEPF